MFEFLQPVPNCLLFLFDKQKDLALTFCRVQEYYESDNSNLKGQYFTFDEFINEMMDDIGNINYFNFWSGFNIPGEIFQNWKNLIGDEPLTNQEIDLLTEIQFSKINKDRFYIIGALKKDKNVINHEIAHALYYLNQDYKNEMVLLNTEFNQNYKKHYNSLLKELKKLQYCDEVLQDEVQAYMSSSIKNELVNDFRMDYETLLPIIKKYRKVLRKYNINKKSN
jgi:hypothetical protein